MVNKKSYGNGAFLRDYWQLLAGRRAEFILFSIPGIMSHLTPFVLAFFLGSIVDFFINYNSGDSLKIFYITVILIGVTGILRVFLRFISKFYLAKIGADLRKEVRLMTVAKLVDLELGWHDGQSTGKNIQKMASGSSSVYRISRFFSNAGLVTTTGIIGSIVIFAALNWRYALFALIFATLYIYIEYYFGKKLSYWQDRMNKIDEKVSGKIHESVSNILTVKSMGLGKKIHSKTSAIEKEYYNIWLMTKKAGDRKMMASKMFSALGYASFIFLVGFDVVSGSISVGSILIYAAYFGTLAAALAEVSNGSHTYIELKSSFGRLMTILGRKTVEREAMHLKEVSIDWEKIEFKDVSFKYKNKLVLDEFNLEIERGEKIGVVGRSGCGKSTLVKLLLGLYHPQKGKILIDGIDVNEYKHSSVVRVVGIVLQDSEVFNSSLVDNITISAQKVDLPSLHRAVKAAQLDGFVSKLPQGLKSVIGEKGYRVSGGERQRIGIARALYRRSDVLVLDEATSALDSKTEQNLQKALESELKDKTLLVVAHRLSTLKNVDEIIVMDKGRIVERGDFKKLIKNKGLFYKLHKVQKH